MPTDLTIGAREDLKYYVGETFLFTLIATDKNNTHIDWTGAQIGDMVIFKKTSSDPTVTIESTNMTVNGDGDIVVTVDDGIEITKGKYFFELPLRPAGGGPRGIYNGKLKVNDRG